MSDRTAQKVTIDNGRVTQTEPILNGDMASSGHAQKGTIDCSEPSCTDPSHHHLDLPDPADFWNGDMKKMLPLPVLAAMAADEMFGKEMDDPAESLFLSALLDETQPLQSELAAKLGATFDANGFHPPDRISLQVFRRKAGFAPKRDDDDMGRFAVAICLREFQVVVFDRKEDIVLNGSLSPFYELEPHPEEEKPKKKKEFSPRPSIPRNRTIVKLPNGKALVKSKEYLCVMAWAFWVDDPIKREEPQGKLGVEQLQKIVDEMKANGDHEKAAELEKIIADAQNPKPRDDGPTVSVYDANESARLGAGLRSREVTMTSDETKQFRRPTEKELEEEYRAEMKASLNGGTTIMKADRFNPLETPEGNKVGLTKKIDLEALKK